MATIVVALLLVVAGHAHPARAAIEARNAGDAAAIRVGGKAFTEQEILAELVAQLIERHTDLRVQRRFGLGGTDICHAALTRSELDVYVEYTGTALVNILGQDPMSGPVGPGVTFRLVAAIYRERFDLEWLPPIGFDNTYAIAIRRELADEFGIGRLSELGSLAPELVGGFTAEFAERPDGLAALEASIGAPFARSIDLDPGLMYDALSNHQVDAIAAFATDPRIDPDVMVVLRDDLQLFPPYQAAPVFRGEVLLRHPELRDALAEIAGTIDDESMRRLNGEVDLAGRSVRDVVTEWLDERGAGHSASVAVATADERRSGVLQLGWERRDQLVRRTIEHLWLVAIGLGVAALLGIPLGIVAERVGRVRGAILGSVEVVQTIPSLAMLAFLFAILGVLGFRPAVVALILYGLLPIVVNTAAGLASVPRAVRLAADAMGMSGPQRLWRVEIPIAMPILLTGLRTSAILIVGIATLSTYIGAGGLGDFIARGLARNDPRLTLLGAIPAALMAVAIGGLFRGFEHVAARRTGLR